MGSDLVDRPDPLTPASPDPGILTHLTYRAAGTNWTYRDISVLCYISLSETSLHDGDVSRQVAPDQNWSQAMPQL